MLNHANTQPQPYIFWLFDWGYRRISTSIRFHARYIRCDLEHGKITLFDTPEAVVIPLEDIEQYEKYDFIDSAGIATSNIRLVIKKNIHLQPIRGQVFKHEIYLVPLDVFEHRPDFDEVEAMHQLLSALYKDDEVNFVRNPYQRKLIKLGKAAEFSSEKWVATVAPNIYKPAPTVFRELGKLILAFLVVMIVGIILIGVIYNLTH